MAKCQWMLSTSSHKVMGLKLHLRKNNTCKYMLIRVKQEDPGGKCT